MDYSYENEIIKIPRYTNNSIILFFSTLFIYNIISIYILRIYPINYELIWQYTLFLTLYTEFIGICLPLSKIYNSINKMLFYILPIIGIFITIYPFIFNNNEINIYFNNYSSILVLLLFNTFINFGFYMYYYYFNYEINNIKYEYNNIQI